MPELKINEQSIKTELKTFSDKPYKCLFEYVWNSFDAGATRVDINFDLPNPDIGYAKNVEIIDNGKGWDFQNKLNTETFLSSSKREISSNSRTLPKGKLGRGRYVFIWIADKIEILSQNKKITLQHSTKISHETVKQKIQGTKISFININQRFSDSLVITDSFHEQLILEFGWFLAENDKLQIATNGSEIDISDNIKSEKKLSVDSFPANIQDQLDDCFDVKIILWAKKPSEYSKFYFLSENSRELYKQNTGLNKKGDNFWHSIYITSNLFKNFDLSTEDEKEMPLDFGDRKIIRTQKQVIKQIKNELTVIRKPYLVKQSEHLLDELKDDNLIPELTTFGIYDEQSYGDLIKTIYTINPSLFTGKKASEKKFICATFAGLLSTQDDVLIKTILEQLQELTEDEKNELLDILNRSSLSNIVKTIKEIDHRFDVLDKLKLLISEYEKETLEVKHLQKILDQNFWIFGEQFRLFSTTEGALKKVLLKYAKEILEIEDPELDTQPNGEVDLFLTKTEAIGNKIQKNIVVELKRASVKLKHRKQYLQLDEYREKILEQNLCNGENQYWEFYLIGKDYDTGIEELIDNAKNYGEKDRGLTLSINDGRVKIYVRKWSDILEVEWGTKMQYLKEKLEIQAQNQNIKSPENIVKKITNLKSSKK